MLARCKSCKRGFVSSHAVRVHRKRSGCGAAGASNDPLLAEDSSQPGATKRRRILEPTPRVEESEGHPAVELPRLEESIGFDLSGEFWTGVGGVDYARVANGSEIPDATATILHQGPEATADSGASSQGAPNREEVLSAGRQLIVSIGEKVGARNFDRFLRLATSPEWGRIFSGPSATLSDARSVSSVAKATLRVQRDVEEHFSHLGFAKQVLFQEQGAQEGLDIFMRSPVEIVRDMLQRTSEKKKNFFFHPLSLFDESSGDRIINHPMSAGIAHNALEGVKEAIYVHPDSDVCWTDESFICFLQIYSDKSSMSLKTTALSFYPLHISLLGFTQAERESSIRSGDTLVAFLPVASSWPGPERREPVFQADGEPVPTGGPIESASFAKSTKGRTQNRNDIGAATGIGGNLGLLPSDIIPSHGNKSTRASLGKHTTDKVHATLPTAPETRDIMAKALGLVLAELRDAAARGVQFADADGVRRKAHLVLVSYVADTPEVSTVACTKNNRCARCDVQISQMGTPGIQGRSRTASSTDQILLVNKLRGASYQGGLQVESVLSGCRDAKGARHMFDHFSEVAQSGITSTRPFFIDWPFAYVHSSLDMYRIMRGDLMHTMPLGLLKTLVTLVTLRLKSDTLTTPRFLDSKRRPKTLRSMRTTFLRVANEVLSNISREAPSTNFRIDFSKHKGPGQLDGLFTDSGVASMLEARDMKNVQQVLPFCAAVLDMLCSGTELDDRGPKDSRQLGGSKTGQDDNDSGPSCSTTEVIVDTEHVEFAPLTSVFVAYNELYERLTGLTDHEAAMRGFTAKDLYKLDGLIKKFKDITHHVFADFQASRFCFPKFHALEHIVQDISDLGCPAFYSADAYEASHVQFKVQNRATSRRRSTALQETTARIARLHGMRNGRLSTAGGADGRPSIVSSVAYPSLSETRPWVVESLLEGKPLSNPTMPQTTREEKNSALHSSTLFDAGLQDKVGVNLSSLNDDSDEEPVPIPGSAQDRSRDGDSGNVAHDTEQRLSKMTPRDAAMATDSCCLVRARGRRLSFKSLLDAVRAIEKDPPSSDSLQKDIVSRSELSDGKLFVASLGGYALAKKALNIFCNQSCGEDLQRLTRHGLHVILSMRFNFVKSAYAAGFRTPSLTEQVDVDMDRASEPQEEPAIFLPNDGTRSLQKVVSSLAYSHSIGLRQDSVLIQGEDPPPDDSVNEGNTESATPMAGNQPHARICAWFAKVLLLTHVSADAGSFKNGEELAVVRYYQVLPKTALGAPDRALGCIKLKWASDVHNDPWIDVVPVSSIRGRVHVVPGDFPLGCVSSAATIKDGHGCSQEEGNINEDAQEDSFSQADSYSHSEGDALFADSATWRERRFFVNRFKAKSVTDTFYKVADL